MDEFKLTSSAFSDGGPIPRECGYKNGNISPPLTILAPAGTRSIALIMDDPDAMEPTGKVWVHWVMYNIFKSDWFKESTHNVHITEHYWSSKVKPKYSKPLTDKRFLNATTQKVKDANKAHLIQSQEERYGTGMNPTELWGGLIGLNDFGEFDYGGPYPPRGTHRYRFKAYALDIDHLQLPRFDKEKGVMRPGTKSDVEEAMKGPVTKDGHIIQETTLTGTYYAD